MEYLGNKDLLGRRLTAFLASRTVQTARVMACYDWATGLCAEEDCVVSGFQSPIERDVMHFLLKKQIPVIVVLARAVYKQVPEELRQAYNNGRVLLISISGARRTTQATATARNNYVAALSATIVFGMLTQESSLYDIYLRYAGSTEKQMLLIQP